MGVVLVVLLLRVAMIDYYYFVVAMRLFVLRVGVSVFCV